MSWRFHSHRVTGESFCVHVIVPDMSRKGFYTLSSEVVGAKCAYPYVGFAVVLLEMVHEMPFEFVDLIAPKLCAKCGGKLHRSC